MKVSVAIVEDNHKIRQGFEELVKTSTDLEMLASFSSAEAFLQKIVMIKPDVVVMDIGLPGMSGIEAVERGRILSPATQFLMCTVYEDDEKIFNSLCAGATGYMLKKTPPAEFISYIIDIHNGGSPMSALIARKVITHFRPQISSATEMDKLSPREGELLEYLSRGYRYKEIADRMFISIDTVRKHIHSIYTKLEVNSRTEALNKLYKN